MTLNGLEITKYCKILFILFLLLCLHNFTISIFRIILDEHAMVLWYLNCIGLQELLHNTECHTRASLVHHLIARH